MKVFAYVGSMHADSVTLKVVENLIGQLAAKTDVSSTVIHARDCDTSFCRGCSKCFTSLHCSLDDSDGFSDIRKKLEESDFVILASPVYLHDVSGVMKNFIDRISYYARSKCLFGKDGLALSTAINNGGSLTVDYLSKTMHLFGINVISRLPLYTETPGTTFEQTLDSVLPDTVEAIIEAHDNTDLHNNVLKYYFNQERLTVRFFSAEDTEKYKCWNENGFLDDCEVEELYRRRKLERLS